MSASANGSASNGSGLDKDSLWGWWREGNRWQSRLHRKATYKALDIPDDEVNINANKTGISALGATAIAAVAGVPSVAMAAVLAMVLMKPASIPIPTPSPTMPNVPDSNYTVRFYDKDGNLIKVPHVSEAKSGNP